MHNARVTHGRKSKPMDIFAADPRRRRDRPCHPGGLRRSYGIARAWSSATDGEIDRAVASKEFSGKLYEALPDAHRRPQVSIATAGGGRTRTSGRLHDRSRAPRRLRHRRDRPAQKKIARIAFAADDALDSSEMIQALAEGLTLAEFDAGHYKTAGYDRFSWMTLPSSPANRLAEAASAAVSRGRIIGHTATWLELWTTSPANFADALRSLPISSQMIAQGGRSGGRSPGPQGARTARHGNAAGRRARKRRTPATGHDPLRPGGRTRKRRSSGWSARASHSTPAAFRSSRRPTWTA